MIRFLRQHLLLMAAISTLFLLNGAWHALKYSAFVAYDSHYMYAYVLKQHCYDTACYLTYRLDNGYMVRSKESALLRNLQGYRVKLWIKSDQVTFIKSLSTFFAPSAIVEVVPNSRLWRFSLADAMRQQHDNIDLGELLAALYLGTPFKRAFYHDLSTLGISHLSAISGFHLGILATLIMSVLYWPYRLLQARYFPYRSRTFDVTGMLLIVLFGYLLLTGFIPSLVRAYAMMVIGYIFYVSGIRLFAFSSLFLAVLWLISLFPSLLFSIGFLLSVLGVFNIFLFLHHVKIAPIWLQSVLLAIWLYLSMLPLSLYLFHTISIYHPFSILASLLFLPFYIIEALLHLFGYGYLLDGWLETYLQLADSSRDITLSGVLIGILGVINIVAMRAKWAFYLLAVSYFAIAVYAIDQI